jgi:hypothetical protein
MLAIACAATAVSVVGCGYWPPIVESARDIERLPPTQIDVRARRLNDEDVQALSRLQSLQSLDFGSGWGAFDANLTDRGLDTLTSLRLPQLEHLTLGFCSHITDSGIATLGRLPKLRILSLMGSGQITDRGLRSIVALPGLRILDLRGCVGITDSGLSMLTTRTDLELLMLGGCQQITEEGLESLRRALPNTEIEKDDQMWARTQRNP